MARVLELDGAAGVRQRRIAETDQFRRGGEQSVGVLGFGESQIEQGQRFDGAHDEFGLAPDEIAQFAQDAPDFVFLFKLQFAPRIIEFDGGQWLDEECRAAGALIVDDAGDTAFELGAQRDDVTPVPLRDQDFLQVRRVVRVVDDPVAVCFAAGHNAIFISRRTIRQLGTRGVHHFAGFRPARARSPVAARRILPGARLSTASMGNWLFSRVNVRRRVVACRSV